MILWYVRHGFSFFPAHYPISETQCSCGEISCTNIGKHPRTRRGVKDATTDKKTVLSWFDLYGSFNPAIATGAVSGFFVLDEDVHKGGAESLVSLESKYEKLPSTWISHTGGGGRHFFFKHPGYQVKNRVGFKPGLDIRGDGGYVIAPPGVHKSGQKYKWGKLLRPDNSELAEAPKWLLDEITDQDVSGNVSSFDTSVAKSPTYWRELFQQPLVEGERNDKITRFAGHLLAKKVDPYVALELLFALNHARGNPPLTDREVFRCLLSVAGREVDKRLRVLHGQ